MGGKQGFIEVGDGRPTRAEGGQGRKGEEVGGEEGERQGKGGEKGAAEVGEQGLVRVGLEEVGGWVGGWEEILFFSIFSFFLF